MWRGLVLEKLAGSELVTKSPVFCYKTCVCFSSFFAVVWDMILCNLVEEYRRFGRTFCLYNQNSFWKWRAYTSANSTCEELHDLYTQQALTGCWNQELWDWRGIWHLRRWGGYHTRFWCGNLRERVHLEDVILDRRIILKLFLKDRLGGLGLGSSGSE